MRETIGGYHILSEIGSGGFGAVYRARDPLSDQDVALKTLTQITNPNDLERFRREARLAYEIGNPNIIRILHYGEDGGDNFIVMELMPLSLRDALASGGLPLSRSVDICRQAALGLQAAHERGVIHRDVKPDNILFDSEGAVKIADFGLAHAEDLPNLTRTGMGIGTGRYMSPEQVMDSKRVDARADIYSFGVTLYEVLTGIHPYDSKQSAKSVRASIPDALGRIVNKCIEMDPERRYQTMDELIQAIANPALVNRCALTDFYEATGGPNWKRNDNWLTDAPLSEWFGLWVEPDGVVSELNLESNNLEGEMPPEIAHLTNLQRFDLSENRLWGKIPPNLGSLAELGYLGLSGNKGITGLIPPELGNLVELRALGLSSTNISGKLPKEIGRLSNLEELYLDNTGINGELPDELFELRELGVLRLSNNGLTGDMPKRLLKLTNLFEVELAGNNWTGCIPGALFNLRWNDLDEINLPICDDC